MDPSGTNTLGLFFLNAGKQIPWSMNPNNNGTVNGQRYAVTIGPDQPVVHVKWHMAARFCNYLTSGNTETGPYVIGSGHEPGRLDRAAAQASWQTILCPADARRMVQSRLPQGHRTHRIGLLGFSESG